MRYKNYYAKQATKNTAVACHQIKSRIRTELIWIVGNKTQFNFEGFVAVNYTHKTNLLIMDDKQMNIKEYYANTKKQPLEQHLFAVGLLASHIVQYFIKEDKNIVKAAFISGCLHDIGKIDPAFQTWIADKTKKKLINNLDEDGQHIDKKVGKFSFEKHPRHNEISLLLYYLLEQQKLNPQTKKTILHAIYWHHAKPIRKEPFKTFHPIYMKLKKNIGNEYKILIPIFRKIIHQIDELADTQNNLINGFLKTADENRLDNLADQYLPKYKRYSEGNEDIEDYLKNITENAKNNIVRSAVVNADQLVSSLNAETLNQYIEESRLPELFDQTILNTQRNLRQNIQSCLEGFEQHYPNSLRNKAQTTAAQELQKMEGVAVLKGAAGCGKTKIALEWALKTKVTKIIWICPRIQVCQGLINDLTSQEYLQESVIELNTGSLKYLYQNNQCKETPEDQIFSGDITITTIDQIINTITTHSKITGLMAYLDAHIVFDEYHEYINMPAFNLLFAELVKCKQLQQKKARTLLVSATPHPYFIEHLLEIDDIIGIPSFNENPYQIEFINFEDGITDQSNPLYKTNQPKNTIIISNTATTAQQSFIQNQATENALLFHSKYTQKDKQILSQKVFDNFKKGGKKTVNLLRSGPIIQASLNISCEKMITEFTTPENWLQRLGRLDRFAENTNINQYITAVPQTIAEKGKQISAYAKFLARFDCFQSAKAWRNFLLNQKLEDTITLNELYKIYDNFLSRSNSSRSNRTRSNGCFKEKC